MSLHIDRNQAGTSGHGRAAGRIVLRLLLLTIAWQAGGAVAQAQFGFGNPNDRPTVSPYLNLFRSNNRNSPVLNYYGLVRPQNRAIQQSQQINRGILSLQQQQLSRQQGQPGRAGIPRYSQLGTTGHPTAFMTIGGVAGVGGGIGGGGSPLGGSFVNDGVGIGVSSVGVPGGGFGAVGDAGGFGAGGGGIGATQGGFGVSGAGFGASAVPGGFSGAGIGTATGHPAVFGAGAGGTGAAFGNQ